MDKSSRSINRLEEYKNGRPTLGPTAAGWWDWWRRWCARPVGISTGVDPAKPPPPPDPVCVCVPLVGSDGKLIPQPSPDVPIPEHTQLARDLSDAAQWA